MITPGPVADADVFAVLPPWESFLTQFVHHGYARLTTPTIGHVANALSLLAAASPITHVVNDDVYKVSTFPNFWSLIVAPSGADKTNSIKIPLSAMATSAPGLQGADPASEEALIKSLTKQPIQILVYPEFSTWLQNTAGSKDNYRRAIKDQFTSLYDCLPQPRTKAKSDLMLTDYRLSVLGACTPSHIETHTEVSDFEQGFMSRFFFAYGVPERTNVRRVPSIEDQQRWQYLLWHLKDMADRRHCAPCVGWEQDSYGDVRDYWEDWQITWRAEHAGLPSRFEGIVSRVPLMAAKIAMLLAWDYAGARGNTPWKISRSLITTSIQIALLHAQGALAMAAMAAPNPRARAMREILEATPCTEWTSTGAILERCPGLMVRALKDYMETLKARGWIEETVKGGVLTRGKIDGGTVFYKRRETQELPQWDDIPQVPAMETASQSASVQSSAPVLPPQFVIPDNVIQFPKKETAPAWTPIMDLGEEVIV